MLRARLRIYVWLHDLASLQCLHTLVYKTSHQVCTEHSHIIASACLAWIGAVHCHLPLTCFLAGAVAISRHPVHHRPAHLLQFLHQRWTGDCGEAATPRCHCRQQGSIQEERFDYKLTMACTTILAVFQLAGVSSITNVLHVNELGLSAAVWVQTMLLVC